MDFGKYEKYMNDRKAVTVENNRRIEKKFAECEKWVADNLINCGCVFTNHSELLDFKRGNALPQYAFHWHLPMLIPWLLSFLFTLP